MKIDMNIYGGNNMVIQDGGVVSTQTFVDGKLVHQRITLNGKDVTTSCAKAHPFRGGMIAAATFSGTL